MHGTDQDPTLKPHELDEVDSEVICPAHHDSPQNKKVDPLALFYFSFQMIAAVLLDSSLGALKFSSTEPDAKNVDTFLPDTRRLQPSID